MRRACVCVCKRDRFQNKVVPLSCIDREDVAYAGVDKEVRMRQSADLDSVSIQSVTWWLIDALTIASKQASSDECKNHGENSKSTAHHHGDSTESRTRFIPLRDLRCARIIPTRICLANLEDIQ